MAAIFKYTVFEPLFTGTLLWALTRGSPEIKARLLKPLASLPFTLSPELLVNVLKGLFAFGLLRKVNSALNRFAFNGWKFSTGGKPWDWQNELCVITGGSGGLGTIVVRHLLNKGVRVAIMDVSPPPASLQSFSKLHFYKCDITDSSSVHEVATQIKKDLGHPSILCNNAGIGKTATITETTDAQLEKIFHINLISHWYTVREFLPGMIQNKKGHIVTTASMASYTTCAGMVDYCVTKAGALAFHEGLCQELKHRYKAPFIQATSVHPYWVKTALITNWVEKRLTSLSAPLLEPEYVGKKIADAILSGKGQHLLLPDIPLMYFAAACRGLPHWFQEACNDTQKDTAH